MFRVSFNLEYEKRGANIAIDFQWMFFTRNVEAFIFFRTVDIYGIVVLFAFFPLQLQLFYLFVVSYLKLTEPYTYMLPPIMIA